MSASTERDLVCRLAVHDPARARARAKEIIEPLFRAQALACVARFASPADVPSVARAALEASAAADDPYHRVAAAAWPIRALIERDLGHTVNDIVSDVIARSNAITNPVSRVDALFLLWQAVYPLGDAMRARVLGPLIEASTRADSWKPQRVLQSLVFMLANEDRVSAESIVAQMAHGKYRRTTERRLAAGERQEPRRFF